MNENETKPENATEAGEVSHSSRLPCSAVRWIVEIRDREFPDLWQSVEVRKDEEAANAKVKEWAQWLIDMKKPPHDIRLVKETTAREIIEPNSVISCHSCDYKTSNQSKPMTE